MDVESARERPLFAVGTDVYRWDDVVAFARVRGEWDALAEDVRTVLAALRELELRDESPADAEVEAAGREFRYRHRLLAGDELAEWLDRRGVTHPEWRAYLERSLARDQLPGVAGPENDVGAYLWPEGICSGCLDELLQTLAGLVVVAPGTSLEALDDAFDTFSRGAATDESIAREIETNRLEWLRFDYETADFGDEDAAREGALCVRNDGDSLATVATRAGVALEQRLDWLEEAESELVSQFLAARPGDLVGPVVVEERFRLAVLRDKRPPLPDDESVRLRAAAAVVERAVARAVSDRVTWLEPL